VHFLICGTQKGGTTALHEYLKGHPDICMSAAKELHFFDNEEIFQKGPPDYSEYHAAFSHRKPHQRIGESTPIYMYWDPAPKRIKEYNPQLKLIVLLRNPIERAYAHWNMERARGADKLSFWDAIQNEPQRIQKRLTPEHRVYSYVDRGFYLSQLERLWAHFPRSRVLVLKHEDLRDHPQTTLRAVTEFLGVSPFKEIHEKKANATPYLSPLTPVERKYLHGIFEEEIHKLERVLKWDCSQWLKD
jgi:hypothetical protein